MTTTALLALSARREQSPKSNVWKETLSDVLQREAARLNRLRRPAVSITTLRFNGVVRTLEGWLCIYTDESGTPHWRGFWPTAEAAAREYDQQLRFYRGPFAEGQNFPLFVAGRTA